ncbi:MAG TPA: GlsB/YeaQ/YmgE family stress response membrane protein [Myxococcaceae bacterium]|nr:GlsB/YeaQ/YmgE family stress response membrane protein [Myxococcaceae bacterium]
MGIVAMIIVGLIAGLLARAIMPGRDPMGWIGTIVLGIVGSFVGGLLGSLVFHDSSPGTSEIHPTGILGSIIGALIVLAIYRLASRRRAVP